MSKCNRCGEYHHWSWHPRGQFAVPPWDNDPECDDEDNSEFCDGWYHQVDDETFHLEGIRRMVCSTCGGDSFQVGHGSYRTVAKCAGCGWEAVIHDG